MTAAYSDQKSLPIEQGKTPTLWKPDPDSY